MLKLFRSAGPLCRRLSDSLMLILLLSLAVRSLAQTDTVDFRYAPARSMATICLIDDWQKTLLTNDGILAYNFGPGPYAVPRTQVAVGIQGKELRVREQFLEEPLIPVVTTILVAEGTQIRQRAFALIPPAAGDRPVQPEMHGPVRRLDGYSRALGWVPPDSSVDPAFQNVAWGTNRPVRYQIDVARGSRKRVALGLCESYKPGPGTRVMELYVEGALPLTVDPLKEGRRNQPQVYIFDGADADGDGRLAVEVHASPTSPDPNPYLNVCWVFPEGTTLLPEALIRGELSLKAEVYLDCGREVEQAAPGIREDVIVADLEGEPATPQVTITSSTTLAFDSTTGLVNSAGAPFVLTRPRAVKAVHDGRALVLTFMPGTSHLEVMAMHGRVGGRDLTVPDIPGALEEVRNYWRHAPVVSRPRIVVPDSGIQMLITTALRTLYQVREVMHGTPAYQPGPTVYRGTWTHDSYWLLEAAAVAGGDTGSVRRAVEALFPFQRPDGRVQIMAPHIMQRETPLFMYIVARTAFLTGDRQWLRHHWDRIMHGYAWLQRARQQTLDDPASVTYGLLPAGFADGGLGGVAPEYTSVLWSMIGLKEAEKAAHWIGREGDARELHALFSAFMGSFRAAARRDMRTDRFGNRYLPARVADTSSATPPQQAQWGLLEAIALGGLFPGEDTLVTGTLAMLDADLREGLAVNTGWLKDGVWPFFAAFHGMAHLWQGNGQAASDQLYAFANHASTLGTWVEEQLPKAVGAKTSGDFSDASASALFLDHVARLLVQERGDRLELLGGVPERWYRPGAHLMLDHLFTGFGPVTLDLTIAADGRSALLRVQPPHRGDRPVTPLLMLDGLRRLGFKDEQGKPLPEQLRLSPRKRVTLRFHK